MSKEDKLTTAYILVGLAIVFYVYFSTGSGLDTLFATFIFVIFSVIPLTISLIIKIYKKSKK